LNLSVGLGLATFLLGAQAKKFPPGTPSVDEIVQRANIMAYYQGKDGRAYVRMTIRDARGRTRQRRFIILRRDIEDGGEQKFYVYVRGPSDVKGMVFMVWKHLGRNDGRWLYLPSLDLVKRIAASDKRTSFVGSHYFYEDVSGRNINEDHHELIDVTDKYFVLRNRPKKPHTVEFSYCDMLIDRKTFLPVQAEYYGKQGKKRRIIKGLKIKTIQGKPTVVKAEVQDLCTKGKTTIEFRRVEYDIDLPENIFTERYLRRPPRKYLR